MTNENIKEFIKDIKRHMWTTHIYFFFQLHLSDSSNVPDHCCKYALSSSDKDFAVVCDHDHNQKCHSCEDLKLTLLDIDAVSGEIEYSPEDQKDEILYTVSQVNFEMFQNMYKNTL